MNEDRDSSNPQTGKLQILRLDESTSTSISSSTLKSTWRPISSSLFGLEIFGDEAYDRLGGTVSISDDGNMVAVATSASNFQNHVGYVKVYRIVNNRAIALVGEKVIGEGPGDGFGWSLSLSGDGMTFIVGAPGIHANANGSAVVLGDSGGYANVYSTRLLPAS